MDSGLKQWPLFLDPPGYYTNSTHTDTHVLTHISRKYVSILNLQSDVAVLLSLLCKQYSPQAGRLIRRNPALFIMLVSRHKDLCTYEGRL